VGDAFLADDETWNHDDVHVGRGPDSRLAKVEFLIRLIVVALSASMTSVLLGCQVYVYGAWQGRDRHSVQ
jgi:hypothetical protein